MRVSDGVLRWLENTAILLLCVAVMIVAWVTLGQAADLPKKKAVAPPPAPIIGTNPFALGISAGLALSPTDNVLTFGGAVLGDGPLKGFPAGPLLGVVASYTLIPVGPAYVDAVAEVHYDFSRGCLGLDCSAERKNGFLLQQGLEIGLTAGQANGLLPTSGQPANWPIPIIVPTNLASNFKLGLRGGMGERWVTLCAVTDMAGDYACGSQAMWAPYAGIGLSFMATTNSEIKAVYDHLFWKQGNSFTPTAAIPLFVNTVTVKQEDDIKLQWLYHF